MLVNFVDYGVNSTPSTRLQRSLHRRAAPQALCQRGRAIDAHTSRAGDELIGAAQWRSRTHRRAQWRWARQRRARKRRAERRRAGRARRGGAPASNALEPSAPPRSSLRSTACSGSTCTAVAPGCAQSRVRARRVYSVYVGSAAGTYGQAERAYSTAAGASTVARAAGIGAQPA